MANNKRQVALCGSCKKVARYSIETREVPVGTLALPMPAVTQWVVVCGECGAETHSCYTNASLEALQKDIAEHRPTRQAKLMRGYKRKFDDFQKVMGVRLSQA